MEHAHRNGFRNLVRSHDDQGNDNPEWHRIRRSGVTATDAARLMTGGSWIDLWSRKTGRVERKDARTERMQWGHWMEPVTLKAYASEYYAGRTVLPSGWLIQSTEHPWILATLDAWTEHPEHGWIPLDAKNTDKFMEGAWDEGAPNNYRWQILHQAIAGGDCPAASIAVTVGGNRLLWDDVEQTSQTRGRLLEVTERFWWHVENDVIPTQADALPETRKALDRLYVPEPENQIELDDEYVAMDDEYVRLCAEIDRRQGDLKPLLEQRDAFQNQFRLAMKDAGEAVLPNGVRWINKRVKRRGYTAAPSEYNKLTRKERD